MEEGTDDVNQYEYAISLETLKLGLDVMGFTLARSQEVFESGIRRVLAELTEFYNYDEDGDFRVELTFIQQLCDGGFEGWQKAAKYIVEVVYPILFWFSASTYIRNTYYKAHAAANCNDTFILFYAFEKKSCR